jgi:NifB/MoaA-like Fe-S oxidoreductase
MEKAFERLVKWLIYGTELFLDDLSIQDVALELKVPIYPVSGVEELIKTIVEDKLK